MTVREIMHLQTWHTYSVASLPKKKPTLSHHVHFWKRPVSTNSAPTKKEQKK